MDINVFHPIPGAYSDWHPVHALPRPRRGSDPLPDQGELRYAETDPCEERSRSQDPSFGRVSALLTLAVLTGGLGSGPLITTLRCWRAEGAGLLEQGRALYEVMH